MKSKEQIAKIYSDVLKEIANEFDNPIHEAVLKTKAELLKWVLDMEDTVLDMDPDISPETVVLDFGVSKFLDIPPIKIKIKNLNEPYRTMLLTAKGFPIVLPPPIPFAMTWHSFIVFPGGSIYRHSFTVDEQVFTYADSPPSLLASMLDRTAKEVLERYK